jgi:hypothetical protein
MIKVFDHAAWALRAERQERIKKLRKLLDSFPHIRDLTGPDIAQHDPILSIDLYQLPVRLSGYIAHLESKADWEYINKAKSFIKDEANETVVIDWRNGDISIFTKLPKDEQLWIDAKNFPGVLPSYREAIEAKYGSFATYDLSTKEVLV